MKISTGRWVCGDDFFGRESELKILESRVHGGNHVLITGQRRMGKTSIARELERRLKSQEWVTLFTDVEGANCPEDVIAEIAAAAHPIRSISSRFASTMRRWFDERVEEISASDYRVKIRAGLSGSWKRYGNEMIRLCAEHERPVLLVIDELPIFLMRLLREEDGAKQVDEFLSWLRSVVQGFGDRSLVLVVSGSIGLTPLVQRLGIPDRVNYFHSFRIGPWDREASIKCFQLLADTHELQIDRGVAEAVYEALGVGIPHYVQSYFARLQEFAMMRNLGLVRVENVNEVYRTGMLGPSGQSDLGHYETRLRNAVDEDTYCIALEILAEAATQDVFTVRAQRRLQQLYSQLIEEAPRRIAEALDVLVHDGYLESGKDGYCFTFRMLKDWWAARFRDHHIPIENRSSDQNGRPHNEPGR